MVWFFLLDVIDDDEDDDDDDDGDAIDTRERCLLLLVQNVAHGLLAMACMVFIFLFLCVLCMYVCLLLLMLLLPCAPYEMSARQHRLASPRLEVATCMWRTWLPVAMLSLLVLCIA